MCTAPPGQSRVHLAYIRGKFLLLPISAGQDPAREQLFRTGISEADLIEQRLQGAGKKPELRLRPLWTNGNWRLKDRDKRQRRRRRKKATAAL